MTRRRPKRGARAGRGRAEAARSGRRSNAASVAGSLTDGTAPLATNASAGHGTGARFRERCGSHPPVTRHEWDVLQEIDQHLDEVGERQEKIQAELAQESLRKLLELRQQGHPAGCQCRPCAEALRACLAAGLWREVAGAGELGTDGAS